MPKTWNTVKSVETTTAPLLPSGVSLKYPRHTGQKIEELGLVKFIIPLLAENISVQRITVMCNEELKRTGSKDTIEKMTLFGWLARQSDEFQETIARARRGILLQQVQEWEAQGMNVREEVRGKIKELMPEHTAKSLKDLTPGQRKDLANLVLKELQVQESGERFMGIGSKDGNRYNVNVNVKVTLVDRMKKLMGSKKKKNAPIDVEFKDAD